MKKVIAINGSPRKNGNTAQLLHKALEGAKNNGAETEMIHLVDLSYQGCVSCFACKRKNTKFIGKCALKDDLSAILAKTVESDVVFLGSPIYIGDVTSLMRAYLERLIFMNISYDDEKSSVFTGKIDMAFFYTMNAKKAESLLFSYVYKLNQGALKKFNGKTTQLISYDTWQFKDYSRYDASQFNEAKKLKSRTTKFPKDCKKAYDIGVTLTT